MPWYRVNGMAVHLKLSGRRDRWPAPCAARIPLDGCSPTVGTSQRCCGISTYLCDWPLAGGGTCSKPLCRDHATQTGPDQHLCPEHAAERRDADGGAPQPSCGQMGLF